MFALKRYHHELDISTSVLISPAMHVQPRPWTLPHFHSELETYILDTTDNYKSLCVFLLCLQRIFFPSFLCCCKVKFLVMNLPLIFYPSAIMLQMSGLGGGFWVWICGEWGENVVELAVYDIYLYLRKICELLLLLLQMGVECGGYD